MMISRQKLIEELETEYEGYKNLYCKTFDSEYRGRMDGIDIAIKVVDDQPPADVPDTNVGEWIQCSERLPDEEGSYLCTYGKYHMGVYRFSNDLYSVDDYDFTEYKGRAGFYAYDSEWGYGEVDYITAWMPLPESYKGVE